MSSIRVAERYAKSLLDLSIESQEVKAVYKDMKALNKGLQSSDLRNLLKSPIIQSTVKIQILDKLFTSAFQPLTMKFLTLVTQKGRENVLDQIVSAFFELYNEYKSITNVTLTSAIALDQAMIDKIALQLEKSDSTRENVTIETIINPDIVGGYILEFDNKQYDASIRGKFQRLRKELSR